MLPTTPLGKGCEMRLHPLLIAFLLIILMGVTFTHEFGPNMMSESTLAAFGKNEELANTDVYQKRGRKGCLEPEELNAEHVR